MTSNVFRKRLDDVRAGMASRKLDVLIVPSSDPHLGEYVPDRWRVIRWLTGFTGSSATVVITRSFAGLWTDSRYFLQAEKQLAGSGFELVRLRIPHTPEHIEWIGEKVKKGWKVGVDGRLISTGNMLLLERAVKSAGAKLDLRADLISSLWTDRPLLPAEQAYELDVRYAGQSRSDKIRKVRERMREKNVDYHLLTASDDIMWLLNIRAGDLKYSPLLLSFAIVGTDQVILFADEDKIPGALKSAFDRDGVILLPYDTVGNVLAHLEPGSYLLLSAGSTPAALFRSIHGNINIVEDLSIPCRLKSVKNSTEVKNLEEAMVSDGVVLTNFLHWLEAAIGNEEVTELSAAARLDMMRSEQDGCLGPSFCTIAAYQEHAALPHYEPDVSTDVRLHNQGIFLLDSGGQYFGGTTDITRTIALGRVDDSMKSDFTLALKGTIALATIRFPRGTKGYQLDVLARKALWDHGLNYGHGTGHGVGSFLNVHEGPQSIGTGASGDIKTVLEPGMVISDEPAIYRPGLYGFRTENLLVCREDCETDHGSFLAFDTVTLCYIDSGLIDISLLDDKEIDWINSYHERVFSSVSERLRPDVKEWLRKKTLPLKRN